MLKLTVNPSGRRPKALTVPNELLAMLSEEARKVVVDDAIDGNQRFKALIEELHWTRKLSLSSVSKLIDVPLTTLWRWMKRLNVEVRDRVTALRLACTGRYKHTKRDFDGGDAEKLKLWFLAHTDASVQLCGKQVLVMLFTPDPYLALLFKGLFGGYGQVGVAPYKGGRGQYAWLLWVYLPLKSFAWLLEKRVPASIDSDNLYNALGVAIDAEGTIYTCKQTGAGTTRFGIAFYNEKRYIIEPLYRALTRLGYNPRLSKVPKGKRTKCGALSNDYHFFTIHDKASVKRLLEHIKLVLPHKMLKACLIRRALSDPAKPVRWEDVKLMYAEVNAIHKALLAESKRLVKALYLKLSELKELLRFKRITRKQYEEERDKLKAEAWRLLEVLKAKYDEAFNGLEELIEARFRARKPKTYP